jgi:hypothetical protein
VPVLPESFLGGSAPHLRTLYLCRIPFPSISNLLLSAHGLVTLTLWKIPDSGYFSPDSMATALSAMTRLETLFLLFDSPRSRPDPASRTLPLTTRFVLPAFTKLVFNGVYAYLEVLLAPINAPLLDDLYIEFFMDHDFDVPQLHRFIGHAEEFNLKTFDYADVSIYNDLIQLRLHPNTIKVDDHRRLELQIKCTELNYQITSLCHLCSSSFPLISALVELEIWEDHNLSLSHWKDDMENARWLELLDLFTALKKLRLTGGTIARRVCGAPQELSGERATEVLPTLQTLVIEGSSLEPAQEAMRSFFAVRQLSGHPVVVYRE